MSVFLILAFLFFLGSLGGWVLELFFRRFFSKNNPDRKWINPGFCTGPYVPLYGEGLCLLYLVSSLENRPWFSHTVGARLLLFGVMAVLMTAIEYLAGILCLRLLKLRLWDYSKEWGNVQGLICPKFSVAWALLGAGYYFLVHPYILHALLWLSENLAFSFFIGLFFGVFIIDIVNSAQLVAKIRRFAAENQVVVRYESIKNEIRRQYEESKKRYSFFRPFHTEAPLSTQLENLMRRAIDGLDDAMDEVKESIENVKDSIESMKDTLEDSLDDMKESLEARIQRK